MAKSTLQKIQESSLKILTRLDSGALYTTCVREAVSLSQAKYGSLFLEKNGRLVRVCSSVPTAYRLHPRKDGNTYQAFADGKARFISKSSLQKIHPEADGKFETIIVIPLIFQEKRVGVLTLQSVKKIEYTEDLKQSLKLFGSFISLAIHNIQLYENATSAVKAREFFMSTAAHELKTPLTTIYAYAQLTQKSMGNNQPIKAKWIDTIVSNCVRLQTLIQELFSMSQMSMGIFQYSFTKTHVSEILEKIVRDNILTSQRTITFHTSLSDQMDVVDADAHTLELVFQNIIANAIKYSCAPAPITVTLGQKGEHLITTISDQGTGIAKKDLQHIFEKFFRGDHTNVSGIGLGMFLCKEIIQAHHGEITVKSTLHKGTRVAVRLPKHI